jgi:hypothetical protein
VVELIAAWGLENLTEPPPMTASMLDIGQSKELIEQRVLCHIYRETGLGMRMPNVLLQSGVPAKVV